VGFQLPRVTYTLDFTDTELDGLEVKARSAPLGMMLRLGSMVDEIGAAPQTEDAEMVRGAMGKLQSLIEMYATVLASWNLEDEDGAPVPASVDGMLTLDPRHLMMIIKAWQQAVTAAPDPLSEPSSNGAPSEALSLPMEPLSASLAS
jgi:hypothetical protein